MVHDRSGTWITLIPGLISQLSLQNSQIQNQAVSQEKSEGLQFHPDLSALQKMDMVWIFLPRNSIPQKSLLCALHDLDLPNEININLHSIYWSSLWVCMIDKEAFFLTNLYFKAITNSQCNLETRKDTKNNKAKPAFRSFCLAQVDRGLDGRKTDFYWKFTIISNYSSGKGLFVVCWIKHASRGQLTCWKYLMCTDVYGKTSKRVHQYRKPDWSTTCTHTHPLLRKIKVFSLWIDNLEWQRRSYFLGEMISCLENQIRLCCEDDQFCQAA